VRQDAVKDLYTATTHIRLLKVVVVEEVVVVVVVVVILKESVSFSRGHDKVSDNGWTSGAGHRHAIPGGVQYLCGRRHGAAGSISDSWIVDTPEEGGQTSTACPGGGATIDDEQLRQKGQQRNVDHARKRAAHSAAFEGVREGGGHVRSELQLCIADRSRMRQGTPSRPMRHVECV
jgi:hypothetical protein